MGLLSRFKEDFVRPGSREVWVRKRVGWGWTINWSEVRRRVRKRRGSGRR